MTLPKPNIIRLSPTSLVPNSKLLLLLYRSAFVSPVSAEAIGKRFSKNEWVPQWRYPMYRRSHCHSATYEALGVFSGSLRLRLGVSDDEAADSGVEEDVHPGDVIAIPAGVAYQCVKEVDGFLMAGAYPKGARQWDMMYGGEDLGEGGVEQSIPTTDPLRGKDENWLPKI